MTFIVSTKPNAGYNGRFKQRATELVKSGTRVGMVWLSAEDATWFCHICQSNHEAPIFAPGRKDAMEPCKGCKTPFVFALV